MATPNYTYIQYFIPADGDVEEHPNVFQLKKAPKGITLGDIQQVCILQTAYRLHHSTSIMLISCL